jgi:hypothetical protein
MAKQERPVISAAMMLWRDWEIKIGVNGRDGDAIYSCCSTPMER